MQSVLACPVCFGQSDSPMAWAMTMGILFMLVLVVGVLVGFASFFVHLVRRARLVEQSARLSGIRLRIGHEVPGNA
jgi:maltodextrin utilization protein YvdJ